MLLFTATVDCLLILSCILCLEAPPLIGRLLSALRLDFVSPTDQIPVITVSVWHFYCECMCTPPGLSVVSLPCFRLLCKYWLLVVHSAWRSGSALEGGVSQYTVVSPLLSARTNCQYTLCEVWRTPLCTARRLLNTYAFEALQEFRGTSPPKCIASRYLARSDPTSSTTSTTRRRKHSLTTWLSGWLGLASCPGERPRSWRYAYTYKYSYTCMHICAYV